MLKISDYWDENGVNSNVVVLFFLHQICFKIGGKVQEKGKDYHAQTVWHLNRVLTHLPSNLPVMVSKNTNLVQALIFPACFL